MDLSAVKNSEVYSTLEDLPTDEGSIYHASCMSGASDTNKKKELRMIHITKCAGSSLESISNKTWGKHDHDYLAAVSDVHTIDAAFWHVPLRFAKPYVLRDLLKKYDLTDYKISNINITVYQDKIKENANPEIIDNFYDKTLFALIRINNEYIHH